MLVEEAPESLPNPQHMPPVTVDEWEVNSPGAHQIQSHDRSHHQCRLLIQHLLQLDELLVILGIFELAAGAVSQRSRTRSTYMLIGLPEEDVIDYVSYAHRYRLGEAGD